MRAGSCLVNELWPGFEGGDKAASGSKELLGTC